MLMSLPQDNVNWNTVTIILLQGTSDSRKLSTTDVITCLLQEYSHLTGSESTDSALAAHAGKSSKPANKSNKHCTYKPCRKKGHLEADCRMKKCDQNKQDEGSSNTCIYHSHVSILGLCPSHFIHPYGQNPTSQKKPYCHGCRGSFGLLIGFYI